LGISADTIFYSERKHENHRADDLIRLISLGGDFEIDVVTATVKALLKGKNTKHI